MREKRSIFDNKRAQRGASMPLALLLFLICAMTAAIVLAAGTVAAGRASNLTDSDQAYYGATSAANLFRDELAGSDGQGHHVTVAVKADSSGTSGTSYQVAVTTDGKAAGGSLSLLERAAISLLFGGKHASTSDQAQAAAQATFTTAGNWEQWPDLSSFVACDVEAFDVKHPSSALNTAQKNALEIEAKASITTDGSLVITFQKKGSGQDDYLAIFNLTCDADIETGELETTDPSNGSEIKYATVTWIPSAVEKG